MMRSVTIDMDQNTMIFRFPILKPLWKEIFKIMKLSSLFSILWRNKFFSIQKDRKKRFSINRGKLVIFQKVWHHSSSKNDKKFKFFLLKFSPALKVGKIKYGLYIIETFCSTSKKTKKTRFSIFRTVVIVPADSHLTVRIRKLNSEYP